MLSFLSNSGLPDSRDKRGRKLPLSPLHHNVRLAAMFLFVVSYQKNICKQFTHNVCRSHRSRVYRNAFLENTKIPLFCIENSGICIWNVRVLLFPVMPDVLDIVIPRAKPSVGKLKTCCKSSSFQFCASPKGLERSLCISQPI